jgi:hypothetical protein
VTPTPDVTVNFMACSRQTVMLGKPRADRGFRRGAAVLEVKHSRP